MFGCFLSCPWLCRATHETYWPWFFQPGGVEACAAAETVVPWFGLALGLADGDPLGLADGDADAEALGEAVGTCCPATGTFFPEALLAVVNPKLAA